MFVLLLSCCCVLEVRLSSGAEMRPMLAPSRRQPGLWIVVLRHAGIDYAHRT